MKKSDTMAGLRTNDGVVRVAWFMCSQCSRAYTDIDKMLHHKYNEHPEVLKALFGPRNKVVDTKEKKPRSRSAKVIKTETESSKSTKPGGGGQAGKFPKARKCAAVVNGSNPEIFKSGTHKLVDFKKDNMNSLKPKPASRKRKIESKPTCSTKEMKTLESPIQAKTNSNTVTLISSNSQISESVTQSKPNELITTGKDADAFRKMFLSSLKMKLQDDKSRAQLLAKSSFPKQPSHSQMSEQPKLTCSQCYRTLDSLENLKSHMVLHKGIHISSLTGAFPTEPMTMPCKLCGKTLTSPPFKCLNCPNEKIKFDIPSAKIKREIPDTWVENENSDPISKLPNLNSGTFVSAEAIATALKQRLQNRRSPQLDFNEAVKYDGVKPKTSQSGRPKIRLSNESHVLKRTDDTGKSRRSSIPGCSKVTLSTSSPLSLSTELSGKLFECELCQKSFKKESNLMTHKRAHLLETGSNTFAAPRNVVATDW